MFFYAYIILIIAASAAIAQTDSSIRRIEADTVVVERSRELTLAAPLVSKADLREIERIAASSSLSQVLPLLHSSLDVRSYGTLGGISLPSFRGLPSEYIAVYRNGIRLTNAQNSLTDLERYTSRGAMNVSLMSSTESAMQGNGVAGAAIMIESPAVPAREYAGGTSVQSYHDAKSLNDKEYYLRLAERFGASSVRLATNYRSTDGAYPFYQRSTGAVIDRENNDAYLATAEIEPVIALSDDEALSALVTFSEAERGVPGADIVDHEGASTPLTRQFDRDWLAGVFYRSDVSERYHHELSASFQSQYETYTDRQKIDDTYDNRIAASNYRARLIAVDDLSLTGELGYTRDMLRSNQHRQGDIFRNRYSVSAAAIYLPANIIQLSGSLRAERVSDITRTEILPAFSATYSIARRLDVAVSFAKFFHPPTFNQLYWSVGGNSSLVPERGESYELRGTYRLPLSEYSSLTLQSAAFLTDIRDQIIWTPGSGGISIPVQVQHVRTSGAELDARFTQQISSDEYLRARLAATYLNRINLVESPLYYGKELPYSAPLRFNGIAEYEWKDIGSISAVYWYRSRRYSDFANNPGTKLPFAATVDVHFRYAGFILARIKLAPQLSVINLTNIQYEDVLNFPLPGRILKLSFDFTYKQ